MPLPVVEFTSTISIGRELLPPCFVDQMPTVKCGCELGSMRSITWAHDGCPPFICPKTEALDYSFKDRATGRTTRWKPRSSQNQPSPRTGSPVQGLTPMLCPPAWTESGVARLVRNYDSVEVLAEVEHRWHWSQRYHFNLEVNGATIIGSMNGTELIRYHDPDATLLGRRNRPGLRRRPHHDKPGQSDRSS